MHRVNQAQRALQRGWSPRWTKRMSNGYSLDVNYTFSRLEDNQFGESNTFSNRQGSALNNYDLDAEFGVSLLDVRAPAERQRHRSSCRSARAASG